jgi:serine/threonine protein kinase
MAPEILGFFQGNDPTVAYSVTVDIWAIGIITVELLFEKHPFANIKEMLDYINGVRPLYLDDSQQEIACTELCKDFLKQLLYPDPIIRPTAGAASNHPWIGIGATPLPEES